MRGLDLQIGGVDSTAHLCVLLYIELVTMLEFGIIKISLWRQHHTGGHWENQLPCQRGYRPTYNGEPDERPTTGTRLDWSKQPQPIPRGKHIVPIGKEVNDICQR